jgi:mono/diheme cytochrome c family protein
LGIASSFSLVLTVAGCADSFSAGPIVYTESKTLTEDVKGKPSLAGKPKLQQKVRTALADLFGATPQNIKVPAGSGIPGGGIRLANWVELPGKPPAKNGQTTTDGSTVVRTGGYGLYRRHCLHCHGVTGAGDGPTAPFLYPIPRDYRKGLFKFTSTPTGARPHRDDLRRTIRDGLPGSSMPSFDALMGENEIEQVIDYVMFLSMRGETELGLIEEGSISDANDPEALSAEIAADIAKGVANKWKTAQSQVVNPPIPRTPSSRASILRGRELFLGKTKEKLECAGCHGPRAMGDGPSFVDQKIFNEVVFGGNPSEREARIASLPDNVKELWTQKLDDWGNPLRPANLNRGIYKGGRRPLDIYWRIAKGITGAQMPAHYPTINHEQIWDLVNFVLALPYDQDLLEPRAMAAEAGSAHAVAGR